MSETGMVERNRSLLKRVVMNSALAILSIAFTLGALEVFLRIKDPFRSRPKRDAPIFASQTYRLAKNRSLGYELKPDAMALFEGIEYRINAAGFRDEPYHVKKKNAKRIIFVGDSLTYGWLIRLKDTYHKQLEKLLKSKGVDAEVMGMGVVGYNTVQEYHLVKDKAIAFNPDLLVIQITPNDFERTVDVRLTQSADQLFLTPYHDVEIPYMFRASPISQWLMKHSHLFKFLNLLLGRLRNKSHPDFQARDVFFLGQEEALEHLERIHDLLARKKIPMAAVIFHFRNRQKEYPYAAIIGRLQQRLQGMKIPYLDLYSRENQSGAEDIWIDGLHLNPVGMGIVAQQLFDFIIPMVAQ